MVKILDAIHETISDPFFRMVTAVVVGNLIMSVVDRWRSGGQWGRS